MVRGGKWSAEAITSALLRKVPLEESSLQRRRRHSSREPSTLEILKGVLGRWPWGRGFGGGGRVAKASLQACCSLGFLPYHFSVILNMLDILCSETLPRLLQRFNLLGKNTW